MRSISAPIRILGPLASALLVAPSVGAQSFYGLAGGLNYAGPAPSLSAHYSSGFALQVSVGRRFGDRLGTRLDAFVNHFAIQGPPVAFGVACPSSGPCGPPGGSDGFADPIGIAGLTASIRLIVDPPQAVRMYLIAGPGAYYVYQHPSEAGAVRPGVSAGGGFSTRVGSRSAVLVEARYHHLFSLPSHPTWLVPLTLGLTF